MGVITQQKGITLLEVLIGFVIFTSSLVSILDYVGNQVYLTHLTDKKQHRVQLVYELFSAGSDQREQARILSTYQDMDVAVTSQKLDEMKVRKNTASIFQTQYSVTDTDNQFEWSVLEVR